MAVDAPQALDQRDAARQFGFARHMRAQLRPGRLALDFQRGGIFAAGAVEQHQRRAGAQPQHAHRVMGERFGQRHALAGRQAGVAVETGQGHGRFAYGWDKAVSLSFRRLGAAIRAGRPPRRALSGTDILPVLKSGAFQSLHLTSD
ncbi:Uncharacterised protein [Bordetella pertussis]|nr:Uncharacterised protein [Bordetella pertussis]